MESSTNSVVTQVAGDSHAGRAASESVATKLQWKLKQALEWVLACVALVLSMPVQLLIAAAIKLDSPGPVLFVQERLGRKGERFRMYKFRSLRWVNHSAPVLNSDGSTRVEEKDDRLTRVGRWLRNGLDELPQLVNVLKGEMAIIGPRPDQPFQREFYTAAEERKLSVLPGITGLPQVSGRNDIPWKDRIRLDLDYIDNRSLWLDFVIALKTVRAFFRREGA